MNKVHKINGFVYVTSDEKPKENQYGIGYAIGIRGVGAEHYLFFHDGSSRGKINAVCEHASTVILTNDNALIDVQKLTPQEVEYLNTVDECEVETENICARCYSNDVNDCWSAKECSDGEFDKIKYQLQLPKQKEMKETEIKAKELVEKYYKSLFDIKLSDTHIMNSARQCAIICQEREVFSLNKMYRWVDENHLRDFRLKLQFEQEVLTHLKEM